MRPLSNASIALSVLLACPAFAHHSATIFDRESVLAFRGTVVSFNWTNPHVYIYVETEGDDGEVIEWEIETDATPILTRSGWTSESFVPGDQVTVRAHPDRRAERKHALLISIAGDDSASMAARSYFLRRADDTQSLASAVDMSGVWELGYADFNAFYQRH